MERLIRLAEEDNVGVAAQAIAVGEEVVVDGISVTARAPIPFAHKIALRSIGPEERVIKYGVPIGRATAAIAPGDHVHVHNIRSDYVNNAVDNFETADDEGAQA